MEPWSATESLQMLHCSSEVTGDYYVALNSLLLTHFLASEKTCKLLLSVQKECPPPSSTKVAKDYSVQEIEGLGNIWQELPLFTKYSKGHGNALWKTLCSHLPTATLAHILIA